MTKILICGSSGKMGKAVYDAVLRTEGVEVICGVDAFSKGELSFTEYTSFNRIVRHNILYASSGTEVPRYRVSQQPSIRPLSMRRASRFFLRKQKKIAFRRCIM